MRRRWREDLRDAGVDNAGYAVYATFVERTLDAQESRKTSIEQRGLAVITTSGTLVTLLFGVVVFATRRESTYALPSTAQPWLIGGIALFIVAAILGLATNYPLGYENIDPEELATIVPEHWHEDAWTAQAKVTETRKDMIVSAMRSNDLKARLLMLAAGVQALALVSIAGGVVRMITTAS